MKKYICIHGHFYQPPRENPWLDAVEVQESAYPFHDWNERITSECYGRNTASRILNGEQHIVDIVNNYSRISFNFGPTLLSWLERKEPDVYQSILEADRLSQKNFNGHGAALAQVYNHMIMPLANTHDKQTQVIWGIKDFEHRFKRFPEGMWLAETAVDLDTLEVLAEQGIKFTILAPRQARRVRKVGYNSDWQDVSDQTIDPKMPYLCRLPSGKEITLFFYDGPVSQAIAFEGLLKDGGSFANRLAGTFNDKNDEAQLMHIATDGESYGHHHRFGEMALVYCLHSVSQNKDVDITIYGDFLEKFPPTYEVEIFDKSSWSCVHGIERWRSDCGCCTGMNMGWNQKWRKPLRMALDILRDDAADVFESEMKKFDKDGWVLRNHYIDVVLNRSEEQVAQFFNEHLPDIVDPHDQVKIRKLLEQQLNAQLMYTSCGWFFDEISGIENVQILKYAACVIQLTLEIAGIDLEEKFLTALQDAQSNISSVGNGSDIYKKMVKPSIVDPLRVGAHYALTSLFQEYPKQVQLYAYLLDTDLYERKTMGRLTLATGQARIRSVRTGEETAIRFAGVHLGEHNFTAAVDVAQSSDEFQKMQDELFKLFSENAVPLLMSSLQEHFKFHDYSLWHLFKQEQKMILDHVLSDATEEVEQSYRQIYERHRSLLIVKDGVRFSLPSALANVVEYVLNLDLSRELQRSKVQLDRLKPIVTEMKRWDFSRHRENLSYVAEQRIFEMILSFKDNPDDITVLENLTGILSCLTSIQLKLDLWKVQNIYFQIGKKMYRQKKFADEDARWLFAFEKMGDMLQVHFD